MTAINVDPWDAEIRLAKQIEDDLLSLLEAVARLHIGGDVLGLLGMAYSNVHGARLEMKNRP